MKAIVYESPYTVECKDVKKPELRDGWTLIKVCYAGVCGSDITIYHGIHSRAKAPLIPGHEFSGYIASENPDFKMGQLVTVYPYMSCGKCDACQKGMAYACRTRKLIGIDRDGGMAEYALVPNEHIYAAPEGVSPMVAAFTEPVAISVHVSRKGGYKPGDSVVLFGAGSIGVATAITLRHFGAPNVTIFEPNPARAELARELKFDVLDTDKDVAAQIMERTNGLGAQFVYDCAGVQPVADAIPKCIAIGGRIVIVAGYKKNPEFDFMQCFLKETSIQLMTNAPRDEYVIASELVAKDPDYAKILNCVLPLDEAKKGFEGVPGSYKVLFECE